LEQGTVIRYYYGEHGMPWGWYNLYDIIVKTASFVQIKMDTDIKPFCTATLIIK
jgi:hypothetical protein